ncbi:MAG: response regulator, partial [Burkholderiales bacterium]
MVVLTVDDHPLIRAALREVLGTLTERVELLEAANPEEGLATLGQRPDLDLVLLDLRFAQHSGLAFLARFRAVAPAVPLVV